MAMQLTRAGEYAVRSLLYLATKDADTRIMASDVASAEDIPITFVRKILETLAKTGLVKSYRGANGGFTLGRSAQHITLRQVIVAIEGPFALNDCLSPSGCEQADGCPVKAVWFEVQQAIEDILDRYNLAEIAQSISKKPPADYVSVD